jgi:hypothetical protein
MEIERRRYEPLGEAWAIRRGALELVVVTEVGPRIMSFRHGDGPNLLFVDTADVRRRDWRFYGGSRFWVSPETESAYHPENSPGEVTVTDDELRVVIPAEPSGLRRSTTIRAAASHAGFEIEYRLANEGEMLARGGAWILTCALGPGRLICPWNEGSAAWATQMVRYWRRWSTFGTDIASPQWHHGNEVFWIDPTGETGKVGLFSAQGLLALVREDGTFVKQSDPVPWASYPDGGCNLEVCTTSRFIEMETLSPLVDLHPGDALVHREQWLFVPQRFGPEDWAALPPLVGRA